MQFSLSLSNEYHHACSLQLANGIDGSKQFFLESIAEAYCSVKEMMLVSVYPLDPSLAFLRQI
jgi:hypothetical protein